MFNQKLICCDVKDLHVVPNSLTKARENLLKNSCKEKSKPERKSKKSNQSPQKSSKLTDCKPPKKNKLIRSQSVNSCVSSTETEVLDESLRVAKFNANQSISKGGNNLNKDDCKSMNRTLTGDLSLFRMYNLDQVIDNYSNSIRGSRVNIGPVRTISSGSSKSKTSHSQFIAHAHDAQPSSPLSLESFDMNDLKRMVSNTSENEHASHQKRNLRKENSAPVCMMSPPMSAAQAHHQRVFIYPEKNAGKYEAEPKIEEIDSDSLIEAYETSGAFSDVTIAFPSSHSYSNAASNAITMVTPLPPQTTNNQNTPQHVQHQSMSRMASYGPSLSILDEEHIEMYESLDPHYENNQNYRIFHAAKPPSMNRVISQRQEAENERIYRNFSQQSGEGDYSFSSSSAVDKPKIYRHSFKGHGAKDRRVPFQFE